MIKLNGYSYNEQDVELLIIILHFSGVNCLLSLSYVNFELSKHRFCNVVVPQMISAKSLTNCESR